MLFLNLLLFLRKAFLPFVAGQNQVYWLCVCVCVFSELSDCFSKLLKGQLKEATYGQGRRWQRGRYLQKWLFTLTLS